MKTTSTLGVIQESISYFVLFLGAFCGGRGGVMASVQLGRLYPGNKIMMVSNDYI